MNLYKILPPYFNQEFSKAKAKNFYLYDLYLSLNIYIK